MKRPVYLRQNDNFLYAKIDVREIALRQFYIENYKRGNDMEIHARTMDRNLLLELSGELDHHGAKNALKEVEMEVDAALPRTLVLDFSGITFMDSSGIALVLRAQQRMRLLDGSVLVRNVPDQAKRVLDAAGIGRLVTIK